MSIQTTITDISTAPPDHIEEYPKTAETPATSEDYNLSVLATLTGEGEKLYGDRTNQICICWGTQIVTPKSFRSHHSGDFFRDKQKWVSSIPEERKWTSVFVNCPDTISRLKRLDLIKNDGACMASLRIEYNCHRIISALIREVTPEGTDGYFNTQATFLIPSNHLNKICIDQIIHFISKLIVQPPE